MRRDLAGGRPPEELAPECPAVYLLPFRDSVLLFAPHHRLASLLSAGAAGSLRRRLEHGGRNDLPPALAPIVDRLSATASPPSVPTGPFLPRKLGLVVTTGCSQRCRYCGVEAGRSAPRTMTPEIAEAGLRYQAGVARRHGLRSLSVYHFGGEPLTALEVLGTVDRLGRRLASDLGVPFRATCTTGGFVSDRAARWAARHLCYVVVSIDGPAELHDALRPAADGGPTHDRVVRTLRLFADEGLPYALRCTVTDRTIGRLPEVVEDLCTRHRPTVVNIEPVTAIGGASRSDIGPPDGRDFVAGVVTAGRIARRHGVGLKLSTVSPESARRSSCGLAEDNLVIAPDGLATGCYHVQGRESPVADRVAFGDVTTDGEVRIDPERLDAVRRLGVERRASCGHCFARFSCAGGCLVAGDPDPDACRAVRALTIWRLLERMRLFDAADTVTIEDADPDPLVLPVAVDDRDTGRRIAS